MWRSRTSICTGSLGCACLLAISIANGACRSRATAVAELETTTGTTERQDGSAPQVWKPAQRGTQYFIADAARVTNGRATLGIAGGAARIVMRDGATLRFTGDPGRLKIAVEAGEVDLSSTGNYTLDVGDDRRTVQIRSPDTGQSSVELTIDNSQVVRNGDTIELTVAGRPRIDAGVRDAAPPVDAPDAEPAVGVASIEITGRRAELLAPGQKAWKPLPPGAGQLAPGSTVRLGPATTARAVAGTAALELASGARLKLGDGGGFALEAGGARAAATAPATVELPGGAIALGTDESAAETRLDAGPRDTRVTVLRGGSKLTGQPGAELAMNLGETALLTRGGAIRVIEAIPRYFDFRVKAGESFTIHDPRPSTAVQFQFDGKCPDGGIIELDRDPRFRAPKLSGGRDFAHALITGGAWSYRL
ncbi:MAG TPA: hypothetical protein VK607_27625, partial [Kofleriaceae bacterium]|nr:hypothetical protein [Kofleriaceae bacterium]